MKKKSITLAIFLSLFSHLHGIIEEADKLFKATLFDKSKERYQDLLAHTPAGSDQLPIRVKLMENLFLLERHREVIQEGAKEYFLTPLEDPELEKIRQRGLYFLALSTGQLGNESEACSLLEKYLHCRGAEYADEVQLQLAQIYGKKDLARAKEIYEALASNKKKPAICFQAQLNLAKLYLKNEEAKKASQLLLEVDKQLPLNDPLRQEHALFLGLSLMKLKQLPEATEWLEKACPQSEALFYLGCAHLHSSNYQKAEAIFLNLLNIPNYKNRAVLALAQSYLLQSNLQKANLLLSQNPLKEGQAEIIFLKARLAASFQEREKLYRELTEGPYQDSLLYGESWYQRGLNAFKESMLLDEDFSEKKSHLNHLAKYCLEKVPSLFLNRKECDEKSSTALYLLGQLYFMQKQPAEAEKQFVRLIETYPESQLICESLKEAAKCSEGEKAQNYRRILFEKYPHSPLAAEAYFNFYSYSDYVQGQRAALKHLHQMCVLFPNSASLITAYYLIGMDEKRDRKTAQGKWLRKKNMLAAIDFLLEAEMNFDRLDALKLIPEEEREFYLHVRYRSTFERALANLHIAEESQGAKRDIFLQYASEVFNQIIQDFKNLKPFLNSSLYPDLLEESSYWLIQTSIKAQDDSAAEILLRQMIERYREAKKTNGYYPSRIWYEWGMIAMRRENFQQALSYLQQSEKAAILDATASKLCLSADQKIDLWIQQSLCYRELQNYDQAMLLLSEAINDDSISSLRVKAMYLRAEIYTLQGRHDLARKQLEAAAKKGGKWANN